MRTNAALRVRPMLGVPIVILVACGSPRASDRGGEPGASRDSVPAEQEATSLLGEALMRPVYSEARRAALERDLEEARARREREGKTEDAMIWVGRRLAYLGRYREAIAEYTRGLELYPDSAKLLRHRGHRYITVRELARAIADLERAAQLVAGQADEIEPDGVPNALGIPLSTLHFNIWYHLGLAHYLQGDLEPAARAWERCLELSGNPDLLVATSDWLYMTLRRLGRDAEAERLLEPIEPELEVVENDSYLERLRLYRGERTPEQLLESSAESEEERGIALATQGYGVGHWFLLQGDAERAREIFRLVVDRSLEDGSWAAFGAIAAEAELARGVEPGAR